jgi:fucose 4-O-acetylase-like acetyltransferase
MDLARGTAILLVVGFHAVALPETHAGVPVEPLVRDVLTVFEPYRMSVLFLLSGMLLERSLQKPWGAYAWGKVRALVWPFVVWMLIGRFVEGYTSALSPDFWYPNNWLWFIAYLAACYAVAPLVAMIPGRWFAGVPLVCWALSAVAPEEDLSKLLYFAGFFFAGHAAVRLRRELRPLEGTLAMVTCLVVAVSLSGILVARDHGVLDLLHSGADAHRPALAPVVLVAVAGLVMIFRRAAGPGGHPDRGPAEVASDAFTAPVSVAALAAADPAASRWLQFLGRNAVVIYLVHFPLQVFLSLRLAEAGLAEPWIVHPLCFGGALAVGLAACALRRFRGVDAFFVLPSRRVASWSRRRSSSGSVRGW